MRQQRHPIIATDLSKGLPPHSHPHLALVTGRKGSPIYQKTDRHPRRRSSNTQIPDSTTRATSDAGCVRRAPSALPRLCPHHPRLLFIANFPKLHKIPICAISRLTSRLFNIQHNGAVCFHPYRALGTLVLNDRHSFVSSYRAMHRLS